MQKVKCDICGEEVKNLGVHKYHKHKETVEPDVVVDEHLPDKQLSRLISDLKELLRQYRADIMVKTVEQSGTVTEIEVMARIQLRR